MFSPTYFHRELFYIIELEERLTKRRLDSLSREYGRSYEEIKQEYKYYKAVYDNGGALG